jgi:hypothetical protein
MTKQSETFRDLSGRLLHHRSETKPAGGGIPSTPAGGEVSSRADRFLARVGQQIAGLDGVQRAAFLDNQLLRWERKYAAWRYSHGTSEFTAAGAEPIVAADFVLTIAGLAAIRRQGRK